MRWEFFPLKACLWKAAMWETLCATFVCVCVCVCVCVFIFVYTHTQIPWQGIKMKQTNQNIYLYIYIYMSFIYNSYLSISETTAGSKAYDSGHVCRCK